jgi:hypothetical protein
MRIAIILDNIHLIETESHIKKILLFEADNNLVTAIDEDIISLSDINFLCLWLLVKQVVKLYCDGLTDEGKSLIERAGVEAYPLKSIRDHPLLHTILLKEEKA